MIDIAVADDHPVFVAGLEALFAQHPHLCLRVKATSSTELIAGLSSEPVKVVLTDFTMPGGRFGDGLSLLSFLRRRFEHVAVVVLTSVSHAAVLRSMLDLGVKGVVSKADPLERVIDAVEAVLAQPQSQPYFSPAIAAVLAAPAGPAPGPLLTRRESEVVRLFVQGLSIGQIADMIARSSKTVSSQKMSAMRKLGARTDAELFDYAARTGLASSSVRTREAKSEQD